MSWTIKFYESVSGQKPIEKFIKTLQPTTTAKLRNQLNLLEEFGPELGMPNAKPIGDGLFELRVRGQEEVRSLYVFCKGDTIIILHAFKKKSMAIPLRELRLAKQRKRETSA